MLNCSFFSISFLFLFFLLTTGNSLSTQLNSRKPYLNYLEPAKYGTSTTSAVFADLINTTCKQCANKSTLLNYNFCLTSLQAVPVSHFTNLYGLTIVTMELALQNATSTISTVEKMLSSKAFDPFAVECLTDCLGLYTDALSMIVNSVKAFFTSQFEITKRLMSSVMEAAATCEEGFEEKEGQVHPLTMENYNLLELSDIALCIASLVSRGMPSLSS